MIGISPSWAADEDAVTVKVRVESPNEPAKAIGLLLSTDGAKQIPDPVIQKVSDKLFDIVFSVSKQMVGESTVATAMAISAAGDITFAGVTPNLRNNYDSLIANIPECPPVDPTSVATMNHLGQWQKLVDVREQRAELARDRLKLALDDATLTRLRNLETAFGLSQPQQLSADLPPAELTDRLTRINNAVHQYQSFKKQNLSASKAK